MSINPLPICSHLYGMENVNEVRDCVMNSIYRRYGPFCNFHQRGLYEMIQNYMVQILVNANRNPRAIKLALPPSHLQPSFFYDLYLQTFNKVESYNKCVEMCRDDVCRRNCLIDRESIVEDKSR
jgi:hypothetical protein